MPLNDDRALLKAAGLNADDYVKIGDTFYAGVAAPEPTTPTTPQITSTAKGAFGRSAAANTIPALIGAGVGVIAGTALSATGVGAPIGVPLIGAALAGGAAAMGAGKVQEQFLSDDFKKQLAADQEQQKLASALGGALPSLITARPTGLGQLANAGRGLIGSASPVAQAAAKELALNTGVNVGTGMALRGASGGEAFGGGDIALDALLGVSMAGRPHNNAINRAFDSAGQAIHEVTPRLVAGAKPDYVGMTTQASLEEELASAVLAAQADKKLAFEAPKAQPDEATLAKQAETEALKAKIIAGEDLNPPKPQVDKETMAYLKQARAAAKKAGFELTAEEEGIISANRALKAQADKEAAAQVEKLSAEAEAAKQQADQEAEIQKQIDEAYATRRRQLEFEAAKQQAEDEAKVDAALKLRKEVEADNAVMEATGEPPKEADPIAEAEAMQKAKQLRDEIRIENASKENAPTTQKPSIEQQPLTQGMFNLVATHFGPQLGIKVSKSHRPIKDEGVGIPKGVIIDNKNAMVTPKATADTPFHEVLGHGFIEQALADEGSGLNKQVKSLIELASNDEKYLAWKAEAENRIAAGKLSSSFDTGVKEYVAQVFGVKLAKGLAGERYVSPKLKYKTELFAKELRRVFKRASAEDMFDLVQDAMVHGARPQGKSSVTAFSQENAPDVPEVPYKSNIARMVQGMKQEKFTKGQLEAEIRKNKSTMEEYDYRGLGKVLPDKLDKATVLKAVEEVSPKIERVNYTDKGTRNEDPFIKLGLTREELLDKYASEDLKADYKRDPAFLERDLKEWATAILATEKTGYIDPSADLIVLSVLKDRGDVRAAEALTYADSFDDRSRFDYLVKQGYKISRENKNAYNEFVDPLTKSSLQYDPKDDPRMARYWTTNPNRSETTLRIPGADYVDRPRSKTHFSNDTFGWIRTSEGEAGGVPTKIGEEAQSDVTKDFRKRTARDEELIRRGEKAKESTDRLEYGYKDIKTRSNEQDTNSVNFTRDIERRGIQAEKETLASTPYLNSDRRLLLKQLILEAERDGFKKIAWTTGDEQAKRNGRDVIEGGRVNWHTNVDAMDPKEASKIRFETPDGTFLANSAVEALRSYETSNPSAVADSSLGLKQKDVVEILARIKRGETSGSYEAISGEGYKNIYDREDVKEARRLGLDPKLEEMSDGITRWTAEITPKASEEARYAFSEAGAPEISSLSSVAKEPGGKYVVDRMITARRDQRALNGQYLNQALLVLQNAHKPDIIYKAAVARRHGESGPTLTPKQEATLARFQAILKAIHDEQRERGLKVQDYENGKLVFRDAKDDPNYIPEVVSSKVYETLSNRPESAEGRKLIKDFLEFKTKQYGSEKLAQEAYDRMIPRKGGSPRLEYNAARLAEGNGLPASWREADFGQVTRKYFSKMAADLAFYKNLQADPAMRQMLAINSDGNSATSPKADTLPDGTDIKNIDYSNHPDVIAALEDMMGRRTMLPIDAQAINRLAKTLMIGIPGKLRDFVATPFIAMEVGGVGTLKHLPKALANIQEGMREVVNRGLADVGRDAWFDNTLSEASTMADKINKFSDTAGAIQGLPQLEQANRGLTWLLGKYIAESKLGDKKFLAEWGPKTPMSPEETVKFIADRTVDAVQGTYDFQGVPTWMRNSALGSVFALSKWSAERYNNFQRHVIKPAAKGELAPLLTSGLGVFLGSAAIDSLNELIKQKKPEHLSWTEWANLGMPETGYKLATAVSSSGVMGIAGDLVLNLYSRANDRQAQEFGIPAINLAENLATRVGQFATAESLDLPKLIHTIAKDNIQTYRDIVSGFDENTDAKRDYRAYDRITNDRSSQFKPSNPFEEKASEMTPEEYAKSSAKKPGSAMRIYDNRNPIEFNKFLTGIGEEKNIERRLIKQYEEDQKEKGRKMLKK